MITLPDLWNEGICGRMGNQMLELAAAKALAIRTGHELVIPECNIGKLINGPIRMISRGDIPEPTQVYREPQYSYDALPSPSAHNSILALHGYFQSYRYFDQEFEQIRDFLRPHDEVWDLAREQTESFGDGLVALCVRRGDYVQKQGYHPVLPLSYYSQAVQELPSFKKLLVFSDDIPWCRENLKLPNLEFVEEHDGWVKLWMMTFVDHHIIANSTYHWWGALLNSTRPKTVIAPHLWFGPLSGLQDKTYDLIPNNWRRI